MNPLVTIGEVKIGPHQPFSLVGGPCVLEEPERVFRIASSLQKLCQELNIPFIFKSSFDKANRTREDSYRGPGLEQGLELLAQIKKELGCLITTDVHLPHQAEPVAGVADLLQIPAFLCRQTDLIRACSQTGRPINIKKGQFVAPEDMGFAIEKALNNGGGGVIVTERGSAFGYHNWIVDMRSIPIIQSLGVPVLFDGTHSVQRPSLNNGVSGGQREFISPLARAAVAAGVNGLFLEVHDDPSVAKSDASTQLPLSDLRPLLEVAQRIYQVNQEFHSV